MPTYDVQFVDSVSATAAVRLDLQANGFKVLDRTVFGMPELRRAVVSTLLADGDSYPAGAYGNRTITLVVRIDGTDEQVAGLLQLVMRELDRARNVLRYRPNTAAPVFFRTFRAAADAIRWDPFAKEVTAQIPAEPFALGLRETLPQVTVYADPAEGATLNSNPNLETDASNWSGLGGTVTRSTSQAHEGTASLLLTPDGVTATVQARSENVPAVAGQTYRASHWVRCSVARSVAVGINWRDAGGNLVAGAASSTVALAANTWTFVETSGVCPAGATQAQLTAATMSGTPPASNTVWIDEARLRQSGGNGGCCFDVTGVKGDYETPLFLRFEQGAITDRRRSVIGVRRRGTPSAAPLAVQAESMALGVDAALGASSDAAMSGAGQNYVRVNFATLPGSQERVSALNWPPTGQDVRGQYRFFARVRASSASDVFSLQLRIRGLSADALPVAGDTYTGNVHLAPQYIDLGVFQLPLGADPGTDGYSETPLPVQAAQNVSLFAGRVSGTGTLDIDHLLLVPADDRLCIVDWPGDTSLTALVLDSARTMVYAVGPGGEIRTTGQVPFVGLPPMVSPGVANRVTMLPDTGERQNDVSNRLTSTYLVTPYYWPRYGYVRAVGA